jgi:hypothetical protein
LFIALILRIDLDCGGSGKIARFFDIDAARRVTAHSSAWKSSSHPFRLFGGALGAGKKRRGIDRHASGASVLTGGARSFAPALPIYFQSNTARLECKTYRGVITQRGLNRYLLIQLTI